MLFRSTEKPAAPTTLTLGDISGLSKTRQRVLTEADKLVGTSSSASISCWDAVYKVYENAKVGAGCVYSDKTGKTYTINNEKMTGAKTITMGTDKRNGDTIFLVYSCPKSSSDTTSEQKLSNIQPGDLLSIAWSENWGHNVIFVRWIDKSKGLAQLFDWNGVTDNGKKFSNGKTCGFASYSSKGTFCKSFRYYTATLTDSVHPVYVHWQPDTDTNKVPSKPTTCPVALPDLGEGTVSSTSRGITTGTPDKGTMAYKISQEAELMLGSTDTSAKFVSRALINAGVSGIPTTESVSYLTSLIEKKREFSEVGINDYKLGDVVIIGKGCQKTYSTGIILVENKGLKFIFFYTNLEGKVRLENLPTNPGIDNELYVYKTYRYTGDTKETISIRTKWNLDTALSKIDELLKLPNRNKGGTYIDNKIFVDGLIFDGVLNENDCKQVRTYFLGLGQKDMAWLKNLLLQKKAVSG